jgi:competence protein ComEA
VRRLGAAAALVVVGAAVASALASPVPSPGESSPLPPPGGGRVGEGGSTQPCDRAPPAAAATTVTTGVVNINEATVEQLQLLPGIGPARAARIVEQRQKRGRFTRLRELRRVKGIGARTLKRLEPMLVLEGPTTLTAKAKPR